MSSHRNDLESTKSIRRWVREEMRTFDASGAQSFFNRTRHLIQEASMSVVKNMRRWGITRLLHLVVLEVIWPRSLRSYQCKAGRGEAGAWGGDLIVFVVPGVGHLTDLVLPGEGIFESFFARRGDIWLLTQTKKTETEHMFPASTLHACAVRFEKIRKSWRPMRTSEGWVDFTACLQISFVLASFWSIEPLKILWYQSKRK